MPIVNASFVTWTSLAVKSFLQGMHTQVKKNPFSSDCNNDLNPENDYLCFKFPGSCWNGNMQLWSDKIVLLC